ncbi:hypothetical protein TG4357_02717 [Thalassovita gelatinovora]|uniref:Lipoprotein n=1 Tax=Thalassovita gelatinovora TaxID=53501 RepID=A0A0P1FFW3_THAGE|nr:hypothetical protein [Thalassovita gelatinovora]QIZ79840.1 hypothetical protein HFZ77_04755 [Thalassovita gelatinovora]CUH66919.1 hypothetical protein TG4357_02717 [Thalassovita gelatinovora]SEQ45149.1 hypothetical protein SAMN04488043_105254 [Thalassovita gelatinovora]
MRGAFILLLTAGLLAGCGVRDKIQGANNRVAFDGVYFKSQLSADKDDPLSFTVTVAPVGLGLDPAREAGRYEATKYCVRNFGNSEVDWAAGPDADADKLTIIEDTLHLSGRCSG